MNILLQFRRYITVGLGSAITDFCLYGILIKFAGFAPFAANLISRPAGGLFSFTVNKVWTFERGQLTGTGSQFLRFWITWLGAYATSETLVWFFNNRLGMGPFPSKIGAEAIACSGVFFVHRYWTFRDRHNFGGG